MLMVIPEAMVRETMQGIMEGIPEVETFWFSGFCDRGYSDKCRDGEILKALTKQNSSTSLCSQLMQSFTDLWVSSLLVTNWKY